MARSSYTVELSKALYEQQRGNPPAYLLKELGAHMLFSHISQHAGVRLVTHQPVRLAGGAEGRCCSYNPIITRRRGEDSPSATILTEMSFVMRDGAHRGVLPIVHTYQNGAQVNQLMRKSLQLIDRLVWGPFVAPEYDEAFRENTDDFMDILGSPGDRRVRDTLGELQAEQDHYVNVLTELADALDIGKPPRQMSHLAEFIVPEELPPEALGSLS